MEDDVWERKYHLALERIERDDREFRAVEEVLRRLALRLAAANSMPACAKRCANWARRRSPRATSPACRPIVGQTLARELDGRAFVARYGGEEFVVVFHHTSPMEAEVLAQALCATVEKLAFHASSRPVTVTMSGGITRFDSNEGAADAFDRADRALYAAKREGRNRCVRL